MYRTPSPLAADARAEIAEALNRTLADGLDLHSQLKVAHWNVRGALFASLHPLFESFATSLAAHNDTVAERAVVLGALALGTTRHVAKSSRLAEYPLQATRDLMHVELLAGALEAYLAGLREGRSLAERHADPDSADIYTAIITEFEKHAWFLRATLAE